jgi:hypothetical protein
MVQQKKRVTSDRAIIGTVDLAYTTRKVAATPLNYDAVNDICRQNEKPLVGASGAGAVMVSAMDDQYGCRVRRRWQSNKRADIRGYF